MSAQARSTPKPPALSVAFTWLAWPVILATIFAGWGVLKAPSAYGYATGTEVVASTRAGGTCETTIVVRGAGRGGTDCPATWTADGREVRGTLTTHYGGTLDSTTGGPDTYRAVAWGTTAATGYDAFDLRWGLLGPFGLLVGAAFLWWGFAGADRRLARKVGREVRGGAVVPWGPFVLHADALQVGGHRLPWNLVRVAGEGKVKRARWTDKTVRLDLAGTTTGDLFPPQLSEAGAFARVVRTFSPAQPSQPV